MIEIHQQKMATALIVAIQVFAFTGLIACIVVGPQDRSSTRGTPDHTTLHGEYRSESTSSIIYPVISHPVLGRPAIILPDTGVAGRPVNTPTYSLAAGRPPNP